MLTLTRRTGQSLLIGPGIEVRIVRIQGDRVVLGVEAPRDVSVVRGELADAITDETRQSSEARHDLLDLVSPPPAPPGGGAAGGSPLPGLGRGPRPAGRA